MRAKACWSQSSPPSPPRERRILGWSGLEGQAHMSRRSDPSPPASLGVDTLLLWGSIPRAPSTAGLAFMGAIYPDPGAFVSWP